MRDYKLVSEKPEAELFADLIRGSRGNRPTEGSAGLMRPEDAPQQERSFMDSFFEYMGMNSDEPDLVARTVANRTPSMTNFVEPEGELLNPWYSLVPITDFLFRDKTEEAIPTLPRMGAAPRMPTSAATAPEMPVVDPVSAEGSTRGETPVSQQQDEAIDLITRIEERLIPLEDFVGEAYKPVESEEYYTIGYGHYGPQVNPDDVMTKEEARQQLRRDIEERLPVIRRRIPEYDNLSPELQVEIAQGWFRGDISGSPKTISLINEGKFEEAAEEFLDNDEYRRAEELGKPGIRPRMEAISAALRAEARR